MLQDLPSAVALRAGVVHLKAPHGGRAAAVFAASIVAAVGVERMLWLARDIHFPLLALLLLHHLSLSPSQNKP